MKSCMTEICQKDDKMDVKKFNLPTENGDKTKINNDVFHLTNIWDTHET